MISEHITSLFAAGDVLIFSFGQQKFHVGQFGRAGVAGN